MSDVTRPVKKYLQSYSEIEDRLADVIYTKFLGSSLTEYEERTVKLIDDAMLYYEFYEFMAVKLLDEPPFVASTPDFFKGTMEQVEKQYLEVFNSIDLNSNQGVREKIKWTR
jgi:hypothetical protein